MLFELYWLTGYDIVVSIINIVMEPNGYQEKSVPDEISKITNCENSNV